MSRSSLDFSELRRNNIYFIDDMFSCHYERKSRDSDISVYDSNSKTIESLVGYKYDSNLVWPSPIWFIPSPY